MGLLDLREHKVLDEVDSATTFECDVLVGHIAVINHAALTSVARSAMHGRLVTSVGPPVAIDDVVRTGHAPNRRWNLTQEVVQGARAEHIHVVIVHVEDLAILSGVVDLIGSYSLFVDYTKRRQKFNTRDVTTVNLLNRWNW